jgi:tetratricopeptide (TPR) repeat protein
MRAATDADSALTLAGERIVFLGRLSSMLQRDAEEHVLSAGGEVLSRLDAKATIVVVGEDAPPPREWLKRDAFVQAEIRGALAAGTLSIIRERELWERLGILDREESVQRLYTPAMLAELVGVSVTTIRRWYRSGLLQPVREVQRLAFFDFAELAAARHLAALAAAGCSLRQIKRAVARLVRSAPDVERPLATLPVVIAGKQLLVRDGEDLVEPEGQLRIDFDAADADEATDADETAARTGDENSRLVIPYVSPDEMITAAADLEDAGDLAGAANMYRAVLAATGPNAEVNFLLADVLYAMGDVTAARERYYAAVEIEEDFVEPRANLGCVLAELGELELAVATFQGALDCFPDYADVHLHLARTLDTLGRRDQAEPHWRAFLRLSPDSLWADEAAERLR